MKALAYILIIVDFALAFLLVEYFHEGDRPISLLRRAVKADHLLLNTRFYVQEAAYHRSHLNLVNAIEELEEVAQQADPQSKAHITTALDDLAKVKVEMDSGKFIMSNINSASIVALNALTYYQIKTAEYYIQNDMLHEAKVALEFGMLHVRNALKFAEGTKKDHEVHIFYEMRAIIEDKNMPQDEMYSKLEFMLHELEDLEIAYHH